MKTFLTYSRHRNIFLHDQYKSWIHKWFKDVRFEGFEYGYYHPTISISNWEEVKAILPKSYTPLKVK